MGAAIAAGSQLEKGIWALLVMPARTKRRVIVVPAGDLRRVLGFSQWPWFSRRAIEMRRKASPVRFIRAVVIPAPRDAGAWK